MLIRINYISWTFYGIETRKKQQQNYRSSFSCIYPWNCFNKWKFLGKQVTREDKNNIPVFFSIYRVFKIRIFQHIYISHNNYIKCTYHLDRFSSFNTMVHDWRSNYHERRLDPIKRFNLTLQFCACPKPEPELSTSYIMVFFVFSGLRWEVIYIYTLHVNYLLDSCSNKWGWM